MAGELAVAVDNAEPVPVSMRAEVVARRDGSLLGFVFILADLTEVKRAEQAREHLEHSLLRVGHGAFGQGVATTPRTADALMRGHPFQCGSAARIFPTPAAGPIGAAAAGN